MYIYVFVFDNRIYLYAAIINSCYHCKDLKFKKIRVELKSLWQQYVAVSTKSARSGVEVNVAAVPERIDRVRVGGFGIGLPMLKIG